MEESEKRASKENQGKTSWKRLLITLAIGGVPTMIFALFDRGWLAGVSLLVTLFVACFAFSARYSPLVFSVYAALCVMLCTAFALDRLLPANWRPGPEARNLIPFIAGAILGLGVVVISWLLLIFISTRWILAVSDSSGIGWWRAFKFVGGRALGFSQASLVVEDGKVAVETPPGIFARFGGPGVLVVRPGNAVVLERAGEITRIVGPGVHQLKRAEIINRPIETKGIVDLRPQGAGVTAEDVFTKDGIPLQITVGMGYQIEPKDVTDSRFEGSVAETELLGKEYPVYRDTVRKAVFQAGLGGWKGMFPGGPVVVLRDLVAAYTLDQLFPLQESEEPNPDERTLRRIEEEVTKRFRRIAAGQGVHFKGLRIQQVALPENVRERMLRRWTAEVERALKVQDAEAERDAMIQLSIGRADSLKKMEEARALASRDAREAIEDAMQTAINVVTGLNKLQLLGHADIAMNIVHVFEQLTVWFGQDQGTMMRYIEAIQSVIQSDGTKTFVFNPPDTLSGSQPGARTVQRLTGQGRVDALPQDGTGESGRS